MSGNVLFYMNRVLKILVDVFVDLATHLRHCYDHNVLDTCCEMHATFLLARKFFEIDPLGCTMMERVL